MGIEEDSEEVKMPRESSEHFARRYWNWGEGGDVRFLFGGLFRCGCEAVAVAVVR